MESGKNWFEALPALFQAELETMQHGLTFFKFINRVPGDHEAKGHLKFNGELSLTEDRKQVVQIIFPHSYPYSPPQIYPLHGVLTESGLQVHQELTQNGPKFTKSFRKGNQYSDDKICLFDDQEAWIPFTHGIGMALQQAKRWLETALSEEGFTQDLIVEENNPVVAHLGQVLCYLPNTLPEAQCGSLLLKSFKESYYTLLQLQIETSTGVQVFESFANGTALAPSKNDFIYGSWVTMEGNAKTVLPVLCNPEGFKLQLQNSYKKPFDELLPSPQAEVRKIIFGFQIQGEFHFFQVGFSKQGLHTVFNHTYLLTKNLSKELFTRVEALFNLEVAASKKVLIVGLGAIGAEVAKELAASNIGHYTLIDDETFDVGNSLRHAADLLYVGEKKVDVAKKIIETRNPKAKVQPLPVNVFNLPLNLLTGILAEVDVVLDFTANKLVERYLNQKAFIEQKKPLIQAAVSKGGLTGIVLAMEPGKSSCINCLAERKLNYVPLSTINTALLLNAPPDYGACSQPALPASGMDTREVAIQAARVTLQILMQNEAVFYPRLPGHQLYWHGPAGSRGHAPFEWEVQDAVPLPSCENCNSKL